MDSAVPVAQDSNMFIEGSVSWVTTTPHEQGTELHIVFDARNPNATKNPAACTMSVSANEVTDNKLGPPDTNLGESVERAAEQWNGQHAEDWLEGKAPDPRLYLN